MLYFFLYLIISCQGTYSFDVIRFEGSRLEGSGSDEGSGNQEELITGNFP